MNEEKRNDFKDALSTALLCGLTFIIVGHLHSYFGDNEAKAATEKTVNTEKIAKIDSVKTDSIKTVRFAQEQTKQKTR